MAHFTKGIESNEKKRILKPYQSESKMYFKLDKTTQQQVLADIRKYTNDFDEIVCHSRDRVTVAYRSGLTNESRESMIA